jgi:hypothetical protein
MQEVRILQDIVSYGKNRTLYAKKNEILKVISVMGDVLILQGKRERFPTHKSNTNYTN